MNPRVTEYGEARRKLKLRDRALHKIANVNYTGIRFEDGQWKLHVGVIKKLPEHDKLLNPAVNFSGLPLIFDEIGEIKALAADRKIKYRPAPSGVSVGHYAITAGTIGVTCFKDGTKHFLSNNHIFANCNASTIGDHILQPGAYDGGANPTDEIGTLAAFIPIVFNDQNNPNHIDCALALPLNPSDLLDEILELGYPTGSKAATVGMGVVKSGRTTGITTGTITEFSGLIAIGYGDAGTAYYDDQIVTGPMLQGGDSGSCLLDALDHRAVGLCFAASTAIGVANRMTEVVTALGVTIYQPDHAIGTTQGATTDTEAGEITLNGYVAYVPGADPHRYFEWGVVSGTYTHEVDCGIAGIGAFSTTISTDPGTHYYVAKVVDGANTDYGTERAVTLEVYVPPPIVTTQGATMDSVVGTITLNGEITYIRDGTPYRYFEWGTESGVYAHEEDCGEGGVGAYSKTISVDVGHYYFRAKATDNTGTMYGAEGGVTLGPPPPIVTTQAAATNPAVRTITLNGDVVYIRNGDPHRYFEWGIWGTENYDDPHIEDCGVGGVGAFSKTITVDYGSYYFRAKATDNTGTDYGAKMAANLTPPSLLWSYHVEGGSNYDFIRFRFYIVPQGTTYISGSVVANGVTLTPVYYPAAGPDELDYHFENMAFPTDEAQVFTYSFSILTNNGVMSSNGAMGRDGTLTGGYSNFTGDVGGLTRYPFGTPSLPITHSFPWLGRFQLIHTLPA